MKYSRSELSYIWLDSFLGLEYKHKKYFFEHSADGLSAFLDKEKPYLISQIGESAYNTLYNSTNSSYLEYILEGLEKRGITAITIQSEAYPEQLKVTDLPPLVLYAKGDISLLNSEIFGIVGSRKSLPLSIGIAERYTESLSGAGFTLATGIAEGIDCTVIKKALAVKGKVISVIAGGFDNIYPKSHTSLVEEITNTGLVITENPPEMVPQAYMFPVRNRIIAGLSRGVLVVSGALRSGTAYTAGYAEEYSRDVFAVPYSIGIDSGKGCNELIKRGAMLTDSPDDILSFYNKQPKKKTIILTEDEKAVLKVLKDGAQHTESICRALNKKIFEIGTILTGLEIKGLIAKTGVNVYGAVGDALEE